jgi:cell division septation protein DedD
VAVGGPCNGKMLHVPSPNPTVSRRQVLVGTAVLTLLGAAVPACGSSPPPPEVDELAAQLERARSDSRLATDAAAAARGESLHALNAVASERSAHAQALSDELVRMRGADAPTSTTAEPTSTTAAPAKAPTTQDVIAALRRSADSATGLAAKLSGYRAGLLGSIAAACTAAYTVALVPPGSPQ